MLIDSSVWLEIFLTGPLQAKCRKALSPDCVVPTLAFFEVYRKLKSRFDEARAMEAMGILTQYPEAALTSEMALLAADLSLEHELPMADAIVLGQARHLGLTLLTLDNDFAGLAGVQILRA